MAWLSSHRFPVIICMIFAVAVRAGGTTLHDESQGSRRRRRSNVESGNDQKTADVLKAVMEEVLILRKQLRDSTKKVEKCVKDTEELREALAALKDVKDSSLPFKVDESSKTVVLKNWNLHIEADTASNNGGNLIVGENHDYQAAKNSFFSGYNHTGVGDGVVIAGGVKNTVKCTAQCHGAATLGGSGNSIINSQKAVAVGGGGNTIEASTFGVIMGGSSNKLNRTSFSTTAGGYGNINEEGHAQSLFGGSSNKIHSSQYSSVLAGIYNKINRSYISAIVGGGNNKVDLGREDVISGGSGNLLSSTSRCHVSGGRRNVIRSGHSSSISGGRANRIGVTAAQEKEGKIVGKYCSIAGGAENRVSADFIFIGGKLANTSEATSEMGYKAEQMESRITQQELEQKIKEQQDPSEETIAKELRRIAGENAEHDSQSM